jgi:O-antigen ligase
VLPPVVHCEPASTCVSAVALLVVPSWLMVVMIVVALLPSMVRWVALGRPWRASAFDGAIVAISIGTLLGWGVSLSNEGADVRLGGLVAAIAVYACIVEHATGTGRLRRAAWILLGSLLVATVALVMTVSPFLRLDRLPPLEVVVRTLDSAGSIGAISGQDWLLQRWRFRASGVGLIAGAGLVAAFALAITGGNWRARLLLLSASGWCAAVILVADNRGSMLATAIGVGVAAALWRPRLILGVPLAGLAMLALIAAGLVQRGLSLRTLGQRFWFWESSLYLAREVPLTGAGLGTQSVQLTYKAYFQPVAPPFSHAHNIYLQSLLEQGIVGMVGTLWFSVAAASIAWQGRLLPDRVARRTSIVAGSVMSVLLIGGLTEIAALTTAGGVLMFAVAGLLVAASQAGPPRVGRHRPGRRTLLVAAVTVLLGVALVWRPVAGLALVQIGTADLNRATLSEDVGRAERQLRLERAVWALRLAVDFLPGSAVAERNLALAYAGAQDDRRARQAADRAKAATEPDDQLGQFQVGRAYAAANVWSEAIRAWQASESAPQLLQLGGRLVRTRNWEQALSAYRAAASVQPNSRGAYEGIARVGQERGDTTDQILAMLAPYIASDPTQADIATHLALVASANVLINDSAPMAALELLAKAETIETTPASALAYGIAATSIGHYSDAVPRLSDAAHFFDDDVEPCRWHVEAYLGMRELERAAAVVRQCLTREEATRRPLRALLLAIQAQVALASGDADAARVLIDEARRLNPSEPRAVDARGRLGDPGQLIHNPGFEWRGWWHALPEREALRPAYVTDSGTPAGTGAVRLPLSTTRPTTLTQRVAGLTPGQRYRLSVLARLESERAVEAIRVRGAEPSVAIAVQPGGWATVDGTFTATSQVVDVVIGAASGTGTLWVDEVRLVAKP